KRWRDPCRGRPRLLATCLSAPPRRPPAGARAALGLGSVFQCSAQVMIAVGALSRGKRECTYFRGRSGEKFTAEQIVITRIPAGGFSLISRRSAPVWPRSTPRPARGVHWS